MILLYWFCYIGSARQDKFLVRTEQGALVDPSFTLAFPSASELCEELLLLQNV